MFVIRICLCLLILGKHNQAQTEGLAQPILLITAQIGEAITLQHFYAKENTAVIVLYKQTVGQTPQLTLTALKRQNNVMLYNDFKDNPHVTAHKSGEIIHVTISETQPSDSAIYYWGKMYANFMTFEEATFVILQESQSRTVVLQQPESESVQPGDSVTLQCTVHTETCAGEHSVYWFRPGSGESPPGIIHTHGHRSDECQRSSGTVSPTQSCVYNFPKRNLSRSDAGTYYCAVATCGEILFGNGTKLDVEGYEHFPLYCLAGALALSVILNVALALNRRKSSENSTEIATNSACTAKQEPSSGAASNKEMFREDLFSEQCRDETVNYAALSFTKKPKVKRNKREVQGETVYTDVRFTHHK